MAKKNRKEKRREENEVREQVIRWYEVGEIGSDMMIRYDDEAVSWFW